MIMFNRAKRFWKVLRSSFQRTIRALKEELKFQRLYLSVVGRKYVPMYSKRSAEMHKIIRARLRINPKNCSHLKGRVAGFRKDYNLSYFIFPDGVHRIRCLSCGRKWFKTDSDWEEALEMFYHSTNGTASSEILLRTPDGQPTEASKR